MWASWPLSTRVVWVLEEKIMFKDLLDFGGDFLVLFQREKQKCLKGVRYSIPKNCIQILGLRKIHSQKLRSTTSACQGALGVSSLTSDTCWVRDTELAQQGSAQGFAHARSVKEKKYIEKRVLSIHLPPSHSCLGFMSCLLLDLSVFCKGRGLNQQQVTWKALMGACFLFLFFV